MSSSNGGKPNHSFDLSGQALSKLLKSPVYKAEQVVRPLGSSSVGFGSFSHSGVRVTLGDNSQHLIHKGSDYGKSSQTVVTDARHMSPAWQVSSSTNFQGTKTVSDFVKTGGPNYNVFTDNCHQASNRMMKHVGRRLSVQLPILHHSYLPIIGGVSSSSSSSLFGSRDAFLYHHDNFLYT